MNHSTSSMGVGVYKVSKDGGSFKLPYIDRMSEEWMLEDKMFSTMYQQGDNGNVRCQYDTRFLSSDKLGHTVCIADGVSSYFIIQIVVTYLISQK